MNIEKFVRERNEALFSLDEKKIKDYAKKYGLSLPEHPIVFWGAVYKSIYNITTTPQDLKQKAKDWLDEHNMSTDIK